MPYNDIGDHMKPKTIKSDKAWKIYQSQIKSLVEPQHIGEYIVVNIKTGEYVLDADELAAAKRAAEKYDPTDLVGLRVGFRTMGRIGCAPGGAAAG
jgi:hypothetical protein